MREGLFIRANLGNARLSYSNLEGANFAFANLENAYLSQCNLNGARFTGARLFNTKFRDNNFAGVIGLDKERFKGLRWGWLPIHRMLEAYPDQCSVMYRSLASHFSSLGLFDDASWATYRAFVMRHRGLTQRLSKTKLWADQLVLAMMNDNVLANKLMQSFPGISGRKRSFRLIAARVVTVFEWIKSLLLGMVVGYGEKPLRVLGNALFTILLYAMVYKYFGAINDRSFESCLYFSAITFTTVGYGDFAPHGIFRLIAASEALTGIVLSGLFLFCLGRRAFGRA